MNTLNTSSYTDEQDDDLDLNMLTLQQAPLKAKYPHVHCHCMQPLIFVIRRTYITTLRRIDDRKNRDRKEDIEKETPIRGSLSNSRIESPELQSKANLN
jgi:hypothetical protein